MIDSGKRALGAWLAFCACVLVACGIDPVACPPLSCEEIKTQIKQENAAHPEFNPDHRADVCADEDDGVAPLPHYLTACKALAECIPECP